jgi:predicted CXXCH cytochrome family protein
MSERALAALALVALLTACGDPGAPRYGGAPPPIDVAYGQCAFCHDSVAVPMYLTGGHGSVSVSCEQCHSQNLTPGRVGPDHRSVPVCVDCHTAEMTHMDPAAGTPQECLVCHTPHGSPNLYLVNQEITVPDGNVVGIDFTNLKGKADGSFASATDPGTGLCEVCHATTTVYNSEGDGAPHFTNNCVVCHKHAAAFAPPD